MSNSAERYVSSSVVLGRISRMFHGNDWREDAILYLGKGIQVLGYNHSTKVGYTPCDNLLEVVNHKVEIPCEVEELLEVYYNDYRLPINREASMLGIADDTHKWNGFGDFYMIDWPYIKTSFETGNIQIYFKEFRFDDEGFIMVPDDGYYRTYLEWYCVYNLLLDGHKPKSNEIGLGYAEQKLDQAKVEARGRRKAMSKDRRRAFAEQWNSFNFGFNDKTIST